MKPEHDPSKNMKRVMDQITGEEPDESRKEELKKSIIANMNLFQKIVYYLRTAFSLSR